MGEPLLYFILITGFIFVIASIIWFAVDLRKAKRLLLIAETEKAELRSIITDAEIMVDELNNFSNYLLNKIDSKNNEAVAFIDKLDQSLVGIKHSADSWQNPDNRLHPDSWQPTQGFVHGDAEAHATSDDLPNIMPSEIDESYVLDSAAYEDGATAYEDGAVVYEDGTVDVTCDAVYEDGTIDVAGDAVHEAGAVYVAGGTVHETDAIDEAGGAVHEAGAVARFDADIAAAITDYATDFGVESATAIVENTAVFGSHTDISSYVETGAFDNYVVDATTDRSAAYYDADKYDADYSVAGYSVASYSAADYSATDYSTADCSAADNYVMDNTKAKLILFPRSDTQTNDANQYRRKSSALARGRKYTEVMHCIDDGMDEASIAKHLKIGRGEVKLILGLQNVAQLK